MHTLKKQYTKQRLLKRLQLIETTIDPQHRRILLEAFNEAEAKQVIARLESIEKFGSTYSLPALTEASKKAAQEALELSGLLGSTSKGLARLKTLGQGISNIFAFTSAVTQLFKQLATVMQLIEKSAPLSDEDKEKAFADAADPALLDKARKALTKAMAPPGLLGFIRGVPYLDDKAMVTELLANSFNSLTAMTEDVNNPANAPTPIADKEDVEDAVAAAKGEEGAEELVAAEEEVPGPVLADTLKKELAQQGVDLANADVQAVITALQAMGKLKESHIRKFVGLLKESAENNRKLRIKYKKRARSSKGQRG